MIQCFVVYHKLCFSHVELRAIRAWVEVGRGLVPRDKVSLCSRNCADFVYVLVDGTCLNPALSQVQRPCVTMAVFARGEERPLRKQTLCFGPVSKS